MVIRIWSLSVALVVISGLIAGVNPAFSADDEDSMESIWADESTPAKTKPATAPEVKTNPAPGTAKPLTPTVVPTVKIPVFNEPVVQLEKPVQVTAPSITSPVKTEEKTIAIPVDKEPVLPTQKAETPPAIFMTPVAGSPVQQPVQQPAQQMDQIQAVQSTVKPTVQGDLSEPSPAKTNASAAAPLSKLDEFAGSHFIKQGGWPGVGPFRAQSGGDVFVDDAGNNLNLHLTGGRISQATFNLVNKTITYDDFLDLQVASEFLLEGLNVKPKTIMEFNQQLEDAKDNLLNQSQSNPVTINAGRYIATVNRQGQQDGKFSYIVSVISKDASPDIIKEHAKDLAKSDIIKPEKENQRKSKTDFIIRQNTPESEPSKSSNNLNETFAKTIQSWQDIKKVAVRQRKTDELEQVLHGKALIRQTDAIKWLSTNHKYYDMNPKGITIERFSEITPGQKYAVYVEIKEISKLTDDATGQVIKEQDDNYKVNYTVEKINDRWYITDSAIVDKATTPTPPHGQGKPNR